MNYEERNAIDIELAKFMGWNGFKKSGRLDGQIVGYPPSGAIIGQPIEPPKFSSDLNAVRMGEIYLTLEGLNFLYIGNLEDLLGLEDEGISVAVNWAVRNATAEQCAQAMLTTFKNRAAEGSGTF